MLFIDKPVSVPMQILGCDSHSLLLNFFLSPDTSICSTMAFPPFKNSDHVFVLAYIDFSGNSQWDVLFNCIAYDYSCADWDGLRDHLSDALSEDVFELSASGAASEFFE